MKLLPDGAGYRAAFAACLFAGAMPPFKARWPLIDVTPDSVTIDDAAIERAIDVEVRAGASGSYIADVVRVVLRSARAQRADWIEVLGAWWTDHLLQAGRRRSPDGGSPATTLATGGPIDHDESTEDDAG